MVVLPVSGLLMMNHYARDTMEMIRTLFFATLLALPLCYLTYMSPKLEKRMSGDLLTKILSISPIITGMVLAFAFYMTGTTSMKVQSVVLWICILVGIVCLKLSLRKSDEKDGAVEQAPATVTADPIPHKEGRPCP
jgi:predicted membrane channel-forming protein YqfA (hemolysin III family)